MFFKENILLMLLVFLVVILLNMFFYSERNINLNERYENYHLHGDILNN